MPWLKHLAGLKKLHSLDLANARVTDAGLMELAGLTGLKLLRVGDRITEKGANQLRQVRPDLQINRR